jgi:hypothetical protein
VPDTDDAEAAPTLTIISKGTALVKNSGWTTASAGPAEMARVANQVQAFPLAAGSQDAALLVNLPPGLYSAQVGSVDGSTGTALVEVYEVPSP